MPVEATALLGTVKVALVVDAGVVGVSTVATAPLLSSCIPTFVQSTPAAHCTATVAALPVMTPTLPGCKLVELTALPAPIAIDHVCGVCAVAGSAMTSAAARIHPATFGPGLMSVLLVFGGMGIRSSGRRSAAATGRGSPA